MANAPCARLTKFIRPRVTDRPQASTNSSIPYATPSNRMVSMAPPVCSIRNPVGWAKAAETRLFRHDACPAVPTRTPKRLPRGHGGADAVPQNRDRGRLCPPYGAPSLSLVGRLHRTLALFDPGEPDDRARAGLV